jgi:integrase/recombinase XerD
MNALCAALRFFFKVTLDRPDLAKHLSFIHEPRKSLPPLAKAMRKRGEGGGAGGVEPRGGGALSGGGGAPPGIKYKAALSVAYGAGLRVSEVVSLKVSDGWSWRSSPPHTPPAS